MTTYKNIFRKYGIQPPIKLFIPTREDVETNGKITESFTTDFNLAYSQLLTTIQFSYAFAGNGLKIIDHELFCSSFQVDFDSSKLHPDFFYTIDLFDHTSQKLNSSALTWLSFDFDFSGTDTNMDKFLTHFSPEYRMQNLFSSSTVAKESAYQSLMRYFNEIWEKSFTTEEPSPFLIELYEYICQEQARLESKDSQNIVDSIYHNERILR